MKVKCAIIAFFAVLHCIVGDNKHHEAFKEASMKCIKDMGLDEGNEKFFYLFFVFENYEKEKIFF